MATSENVTDGVAALENLTGFQRDCLAVIFSMKSPSGQDILDELRDNYEDDITHGRLYPNLDSLVEIGLVEKGELDRRTNYYEATTEAHKRMSAWTQMVENAKR